VNVHGNVREVTVDMKDAAQDTVDVSVVERGVHVSMVARALPARQMSASAVAELGGQRP
jgi:hypothetical protein